MENTSITKNENHQFLANLLQEYYHTRAVFPNIAISYFRNTALKTIVEKIQIYIAENAGLGAPLSARITAAARW